MSNPLARFSLIAGSLSLLCAAALACGSFAQSSDSSSDSSNNSSKSSSDSSTSSSPGHDKDDDQKSSRFDQDVEQYTVSFLAAGGSDAQSFFSGLGDLARQHGVSDWEAEPAVWEAIGRGLARSPASPAQRLAYQAAWTGGDAGKQSAVSKGLTAVQ